MPELDDNKTEDLEPSTSSDLDEQAAPETEAPEDANSSLATGEEASEESDVLSVVRDVVGQGEEEQPEEESASPAEGGEETEPEAGDDEAPKAKEQDDEDYTDVPFHKHPRFQQLLRRSKAYKEDAERYQNVQTFLDQHGVAAEEAAELLVIGGLMKTNPIEAWKRMKPAVQKVLVAAGEVLPDDLKDRVQKGELSQQAALEVSRLRSEQQAGQAQRQFEQQRQEQLRQQEAAQALQNSAQSWEQDRRAKDPNFDAKYDALLDKVYALQRREGRPSTPEGVRDQLNRAYRELTPPASQKPAQRPAPKATNSSGQVAGNQRPAEQSTLDIIRAHVGAS